MSTEIYPLAFLSGFVFNCPAGASKQSGLELNAWVKLHITPQKKLNTYRVVAVNRHGDTVNTVNDTDGTRLY